MRTARSPSFAQGGESDVLVLTGKFDPSAAREAMRRLDGIEVAAAEEGVLRLALRGATRRLPDLFAALAAAGAEIRETTLSQPNLESLFIRLTGKKLRE